MTPLAETVEALVLERNRYQKALRRIANLNNGPDQASGEWRAQEAAAIAQRAIDGKD